jgi:hypothetical protein
VWLFDIVDRKPAPVFPGRDAAGCALRYAGETRGQSRYGKATAVLYPRAINAKPAIYLSAQRVHQPVGRMVPSTSLQDNGGEKLVQLSQRWSPFGWS